MPRSLQREQRQRLAPGGRQALIGGELHRALQVRAHPRRVTRRRSPQPAPHLQHAGPKRRGSLSRRRRCPLQPSLRRVHIIQVEVRHCRSSGREELQGAIPDHTGLPVRLLAPGDRQIWNDLCPGEDVGSVEHLSLRERPFALLRHGVHPRGQAADLLDVPAGARAEVDVGRPAHVRQGDDRGHGASAVPGSLVQLHRPLEAVTRLLHDGGDRSGREDVLERRSARDRRDERDVLAGHHSLDEPLPAPGQGDDAELAYGSRQARLVLQFLRQVLGPPVRFVRRVEVDIMRRDGEGLSQRHVDEGLAELETGRELDSTIAFLTSSPADPTSQLGGLIPILREAEGGRATELNLHLEVCVAQCLGQRGDFSQSFQPVAGATKHVEGVVTRLEQREPVLRGGGGGQGELHDSEDLLGSAGRQCVAGGLDREADADRGIPGRLGVVGQQREAPRGRLA